MNIKDRTVKMKIPNLLFNRSYSNGVLIFILGFALVNYVWGSMDHPSFGMMAVFLINFITVLTLAFAAIGPGEALKEPSYSSDVDNREINKSDFKRMGIYLVIYTVITLSINAVFPKEHIQPKQTVDKHIQIKSVKFIDVHHPDKDSFAIRYFDKDGGNVFTDTYTDKASRTMVYKQIFDSNGKVIVDIDYYERNGKAFVEISAKAIQL